MSYTYATERPKLFTEEGQMLFLAIRDRTHELLKQSGAVRLQEAALNAGQTGGTWQMIACMDRMVELGELREIEQQGVAGQHRVFVKGRLA